MFPPICHIYTPAAPRYNRNIQRKGAVENLKKILFDRPESAVLAEVPDRMPEPGELRIQMAYSALSAGTERASLTMGTDGFPRASGYSGSGVVTHVGAGVTEFAVGDRLMVHGGGHQQFCTVPQSEILVPLPDTVRMEDGALVIVAGFSLAGVRKARIELGESAAVVGLGLLGLFAIQYLKAVGAWPIIAVDFSAERRALAQQLGADFCLDPATPDYTESVMRITRQKGVNAVIEVTGNGAALNQALRYTAKFGRVVLLGCTRVPTEVNFYRDVHWPGIELIGAHSGARPQLESRPGCWTEKDDCIVTIDMLAAHRLDFAPIIHRIVSPAQAHEVYDQLVHDPSFPIGVLFDWAHFAG